MQFSREDCQVWSGVVENTEGLLVIRRWFRRGVLNIVDKTLGLTVGEISVPQSAKLLFVDSQNNFPLSRSLSSGISPSMITCIGRPKRIPWGLNGASGGAKYVMHLWLQLV